MRNNISGAAGPGKRRRGNPNWTNERYSYEAPQPSEFEKLLTKQGLNLSQSCEELAANPKIADYARRYAPSRFVPEGLLKLLGLNSTESNF